MEDSDDLSEEQQGALLLLLEAEVIKTELDEVCCLLSVLLNVDLINVIEGLVFFESRGHEGLMIDLGLLEQNVEEMLDDLPELLLQDWLDLQLGQLL